VRKFASDVHTWKEKRPSTRISKKEKKSPWKKKTYVAAGPGVWGLRQGLAPTWPVATRGWVSGGVIIFKRGNHGEGEGEANDKPKLQDPPFAA